MNEETMQDLRPQLIGRSQPNAGKKVGKYRIKARHIRQQYRQLILAHFRQVESTEETATEFGLPARTVSDVVLLAALERPLESPGRIEPASALAVITQLRRQA